MVIIGVILTIGCLIGFTGAILEGEYASAFIVVVFFVVGVGLWVGDVNSPVETTEYIIQTSDLERYGLKVEAEEGTIFNVRVIESDPTNRGAIWNEHTEYKLILKEENK